MSDSGSEVGVDLVCASTVDAGHSGCQAARSWTWKSRGNISTRFSVSAIPLKLLHVWRRIASGDTLKAAPTAASTLARLPGRRGGDSDRSPKGWSVSRRSRSAGTSRRLFQDLACDALTEKYAPAATADSVSSGEPSHQCRIAARGRNSRSSLTTRPVAGSCGAIAAGGCPRPLPGWRAGL